MINSGREWDWMDEKKPKIVEKEKIVKLPGHTKGWIMEAAKHAKRRGSIIPENFDRFFD
jgi:hypothetical protein